MLDLNGVIGSCVGAHARRWIVLLLVALAGPAGAQEASSMTGDQAYARAIAYVQARFARIEVERGTEERLRVALSEIERLKVLANGRNVSAEKALKAFARGDGKQALDSLIVQADAKSKATSHSAQLAAEEYKRIGALAFAIDPPRALAAYQSALKLSPNDTEALQQLWALYRMFDRLGESESIAERLSIEVDPAIRAQGLLDKGDDAESRGDQVSAEFSLNAALRLAKDIGSKHVEAWAIVRLGVLAAEQSQLIVGDNYARQALALSDELQDEALASTALSILGSDSLGRKDWQAANMYYSQALDIDVRHNLRTEEARNLENLGILAFNREDIGSMGAYGSKSLALARELGLRRVEAASLSLLGIAFSKYGDKYKSCEYFNAARNIYNDTGTAAHREARNNEHNMKAAGC